MDDVPPDSENTQDLLGRVRAGAGEALSRLLAGHQDYLLRFVGLRLDPRLKSRVDPADVVQETFLDAVRRLDRYLEGPALPFRLWLRQLAFDRLLKMRQHHAATACRALEREVPLPEKSSLVFAERLLAGGSTPSQQVSRRELARQLRQALARLGESDREVLLLRHFEGLSNQEVGCLLGIDPAAASKRHGRAMLRLHQLLFADGLTESQL